MNKTPIEIPDDEESISILELEQAFWINPVEESDDFNNNNRILILKAFYFNNYVYDL